MKPLARLSVLLAIIILGALLLGAAASRQAGEVTVWRTEVIETLPHTTHGWTQGLEHYEGQIYESGGGFGTSFVSVSRLGQAVGDRRQALADHEFGEGLTVDGDRLLQLTWRNQVLIEWDRATLQEVRRHALPGEAWGLCRLDEGKLVISNGTSLLAVRDRATLKVVRDMNAHGPGGPLTSLNELECNGASVYANVLSSGWFVQLSADAAELQACIDASTLVALEGANVGPLNGLAAAGEGTFLVTGKGWPHMYRVRLVRVSSPTMDGAPTGCRSIALSA